MALEVRKLGPISINVRITAVRKLAAEASDNSLLAPELAVVTARIKGVNASGVDTGNWLSPVRTGEPDHDARPAARQLVVHFGLDRPARARADDPDAIVDEDRHRRVD